MRRTLLFSLKRSLWFASLLAACLLAATEIPAEITGSAHDFTSTGKWHQLTETEICRVCHIPHGAYDDGPLWNHQVTTTVFTLYSSSSLNSSPEQPSGVSKLCLSCHDGTLAINAYQGSYSADDGISAMFIPGVSASLANDHPISFTYDTTLADSDGALNDPATAPSGIGGTIVEDLLVDGRMECSSCHDVHNSFPYNTWLLKVPRTELCLTCHNP